MSTEYAKSINGIVHFVTPMGGEQAGYFIGQKMGRAA